MKNCFGNCYRFGLDDSFYRQACADEEGRLYELSGFSETSLKLVPLDFIGDDKWVSLSTFAGMLERAYKLEPELVPDHVFRDVAVARTIASRENPDQFDWYRHGAEDEECKLYELVSIVDDNTFVFSSMDETPSGFYIASRPEAEQMLLRFCGDPDFSPVDTCDASSIRKFFNEGLKEEEPELCFSFS